MSHHIGPRTISATGGSIKRVGNYRIHTFPSELVTDGLVLNLDAGDPRSYPGSGTTWTDLSGNGRIGTITNATYINANGGNLVFANGSGTFVTVSNPPTFFSDYTLICWFYATSFGTNVNGLISYGNEATSQRRGLFLRDNGTGNLKVVSSTYSSNIFGNTTLALNTWYHAAVTVSSTGEAKIYLNGVLDGTGTNTLVTPASNTLYVGRTGTGEYFTGRIPSAQIYNRVLSAAEVAQNYDALKVRYTTYTNTFTPLCGGGEGKVEVLCVAGGGGGASGGGGAGGLLYDSAFSVPSNSTINLTVGAGGTSGNCDTISGSQAIQGQNSTFGALTSVGGGKGGQAGAYETGGNGGSGGGAAANGAAANNGGSGTSGQGNDGGGNGGFTTSPFGVGGGGGAGSVGVTATSARAFPGGSGLSYSISGESKFYSGGGGGGAYYGSLNGIGGSGVGGDGAKDAGLGINAIPNTGSGGGGGSAAKLAGNGSNGTVIVRYPATDYNVELLIVAGGGGGGYCLLGDGGGGGGGAGGVIYYSSYPVSAGTKYSVTVGAGGTGSTVTDGTVNGSNGLNSTFNSLTAIGGGGGGSTRNSITLNVGGSGGGAGSDIGNDTGGFGTSGQGNNGGNNNTGSVGAGGGGAGAVGTSVTTGTDVPNGGVGLAYAITGTSTYYAGGGGGGKYSGGSGNAGTGGLGGGGNGGKGAAGSNGTANTGGGGGGGGGGFAGGNGGSGIIIIAYQGPQRGLGGTVDTTSRPGYTLHKFTTTGSDIFIP
jgi:hypothetical protein